jgi:hypothetical protein
VPRPNTTNPGESRGNIIPSMFPDGRKIWSTHGDHFFVTAVPPMVL